MGPYHGTNAITLPLGYVIWQVLLLTFCSSLMKGDHMNNHLIEAANVLMQLHAEETAAGYVAAIAVLTDTHVHDCNLSPNLLGKAHVIYKQMLSSGARQSSVYIQLHTAPEETHQLPAEAVLVSIEGEVPSGMYTLVPLAVRLAMQGTGVNDYLLEEMWAHSPLYRARIGRKARVFAHLCRLGQIENPSGFFRAAVKENWWLDIRYQKDWKREQQAKKEQRRVQVPDLDPQTVDHERTARFLSRLSSPPVPTSA